MSIDDLLARVQDPPGGGSKCWATKVDGDAAEFVGAIHELLAGGTDVNMAETARILTGEYGVRIEQTSVRNHFSHHTVDELG